MKTGQLRGEWQFVNERPRGMTSWVLGDVEDSMSHQPLPLRSAGYGVVGASRNQGTNVVGGGNLAYRIDQTLEVPARKARCACPRSFTLWSRALM
jgi:hypothetical protein